MLESVSPGKLPRIPGLGIDAVVHRAISAGLASLCQISRRCGHACRVVGSRRGAGLGCTALVDRVSCCCVVACWTTCRILSASSGTHPWSCPERFIQAQQLIETWEASLTIVKHKKTL